MDSETLNKKMEIILHNFDFEKVQRVMIFLNWKWKDNGESYFPTIEQMKTNATQLMIECKINQTICSGGFCVSKSKETIFLWFSAAEWGC